MTKATTNVITEDIQVTMDQSLTPTSTQAFYNTVGISSSWSGRYWWSCSEPTNLNHDL